MAELASVILAYRSDRTIGRCPDQFCAEAPGAEIVVVDSAAPWGSARVADAEHAGQATGASLAAAPDDDHHRDRGIAPPPASPLRRAPQTRRR